MLKPEIFVTKLGAAKGVARSRIWIEGKRLTAAGFIVGSYFHKVWAPSDELVVVGPNATRPHLILALASYDDVCTAMPCKVSGKGDKPIIDITGRCVLERFGEDYSHVQCTFTDCSIAIVGVNP